MVQYLDTCVFSFFETNPTGTYISEPLTSFERMMLHSIAHYYELNSFSKFSPITLITILKVLENNSRCTFSHIGFIPEDRVEKLTKVTNNLNYFSPPCLCLSRFLEEHLWKNSDSSKATLLITLYGIATTLFKNHMSLQ
jgi:hypothetical protein